MELNDSMISKNKIEPLNKDGEENEGFHAEEDPEEAEGLEGTEDPVEDNDRDELEDPPDSPLGYLKVAPDPETLSETRSRTWSHAIKKNLKLLTNVEHKVRNTDYVLVFKRNKKENNSKKENSKKKKRSYFVKQLRQMGLKVEFANLAYLKTTDETDTQATDEQYVQFIKLEAPYDFLTRYAEILNINMPLRPDLVSVINEYKKVKMELEQVEEEQEDEEEDEGEVLKILLDEDEEEDDTEDNVSEMDLKVESFWSGLWNTLKSSNTKIADDNDYFTAIFREDKLEFFDVHSRKNPNGKPIEKFFSEADRIRMIAYALSQAEFGKKKSGKSAGFGIKRLVNQGVFIEAYPIHDGVIEASEAEELDIEKSKGIKEEDFDWKDSMRYALHEEWSRYKNCFKVQPLDQVKNYFGETIGLYFAFIGYYTFWLSGIALFGLGTFIYGLVTMNSNTFIQEIKDDSRYLCPRCDKSCNYYMLNSTITSAKFSYIFDNEATLIYGCFVALWGILFLEFWKRRQFELQYDWDLSELQTDHHPIRTEYETAAAKMGNKKRLNPETGEIEAFISNSRIYPRRFSSLGFVLTGVTILIFSAIGVIIYRVVVEQAVSDSWDEWFFNSGTIDDDSLLKTIISPGMFTSITASLVDLIVIVILDVIFLYLAKWFTDLEVPRTQQEYDDSYSIKVFAFKFCNYYSTLFYIAFVKDAFVGYPGNYHYIIKDCADDGGGSGFRWQGCDDGGCSSDLAIQLIFVMIGSQFVELIGKGVLNFFGSRFFDRRKDKLIFDDNNQKTQWEKDFKLLAPENWTNEYLGLSIQFGFVILFSSAFPLAPLFAIILNFLKIRTNAKQLTKYSKRTTPKKTSNIGIWEGIFRFLAFLSIVTNGAQLAFTSNIVTKLLYYFDNGSLEGFANYLYSSFQVDLFPTCSAPIYGDGYIDPDKQLDITSCYFKGFRSYVNYNETSSQTNVPFDQMEGNWDYEPTLTYWKDYMVKFCFTLCFNYAIFVSVKALVYLVPDRPWQLQEKIKIEQYLIREVLNLNIDEQALEQAREELEELKELGQGSDERPDTADVVESDDEAVERIQAIIASRKPSAATQFAENILQATGEAPIDTIVIDETTNETTKPDSQSEASQDQNEDEENPTTAVTSQF